MKTSLLPGRITASLALAGLLLCGARGAIAAAMLVTPQDAIARAVASRFGGGVDVTVTAIDTDVAGAPALEAVPDAGARTGQPVRYVLVANGQRLGAAIASVRVVGRYARAARAIDRGESITEAAVSVVNGELPPTAFRPIPGGAELIGLKARRAIAAGEALTPMVLTVPPAVRSGDRVVVNVVVGSIHASGTAVASGSGQVGDIIHVLQPDRRVPLKVRIQAPGVVEALR